MLLCSYNIQYGLGRDRRYDLARIAAEIESADIVALQEVDRFWQRSGMVDTPAELASHLPDFHWVYGPNLDMAADFRDEAGRIVHRRRQFGTMILARHPILSSRNHLLPKYGTLEHHSIQQGTLEAVIEAPWGPLRVYSVHLSHLCSATRLPQVDALLAIHGRAFAEGGAWCGGHPDPDAGWTEGAMPPMPREAVLMGDFNFTVDGPEYERFVGPSDKRYGRIGARDGFVDAWVASGHDERDGVTCDNGKRIDYVFVAAALRDRIRKSWIDSDARGSDHRPIWVELAD